jgi:negative regulator of flagellin synthesis FlgM
MTIEITGPSTPKPGSTPDGRARSIRGDAANQQDNKGDSAAQDKVSLTSTAALLHKLDGELSATPVVDTARVNRIRAAIGGGSYTIDPDRVAGKLIRFELAIQSRSSSRGG